MDVVGRREAPIFTWNPVEQMWVQENQVASKPPPSPHDVHAIQTWFYDPDENEWIQTVLGPMGRRLAERWQGAHRVPEAAVLPKVSRPSPHRRQLTFATAAIVLIAVISGAALAAPNFLGSPAATNRPLATGTAAVAPTVAPTVSAPPVATPASTAEPTAEPTQPPPARTPVPTVRPTLRPSGPSVTLANGTVVTYTGPVVANRGGFLPASFVVSLANGRPGAGNFAIILDTANIANRRVVTGALNASGRIALDVPTNVTVGSYQLTFSYGGETRPIAVVTIR